MAHKWLIKAEFTAYKVYRYFTQVCLGRFMCKLSVSGLQIISTHPPKKKTLKTSLEKWPFGWTLYGTELEASKKFKPSVLVLINVTGNAWGSREAQGGWHLAVSLGGTASSDNLAVTLTSSHVYTPPSMKSGVSPNPEGMESFVKTAESPTH